MTRGPLRPRPLPPGHISIRELTDPDGAYKLLRGVIMREVDTHRLPLAPGFLRRHGAPLMFLIKDVEAWWPEYLKRFHNLKPWDDK